MADATYSEYGQVLGSGHRAGADVSYSLTFNAVMLPPGFRIHCPIMQNPEPHNSHGTGIIGTVQIEIDIQTLWAGDIRPIPNLLVWR